MQGKVDVLIAGAGPVGLLLATELARDGVDVAVIDALQERVYFCKALGITARTLEVFADLGIDQEAIDAGIWMSGIDTFDNGSLVHAADLALKGVPYGALSLAQFETERLLERALRRHGQAVRYDCALTGFAETADGVVAQVRDGDGTTREVHCRWLVGCDGAHSKVRSQIGMDFAGGKYPQTFVLADIDVTWDLPRGRAYRFNSSRDTTRLSMAAIPIHGSPRRYRLSTALPDANAASPGSGRPAPDIDEIRAIMLPLLPPGTKLDAMRWSSLYKISHRIVPHYGKGHAFLAGDAAHIHPPVGGQGMNTGLQDAHNLAWKLTLAARGLAAPGLLDSYSDERYPVGLDVVEETSRALNAVLAQQARTPGMRETQLLVGYRGSAIVTGDAPADASLPAPGDRAPDAGPLRQRFVAKPGHLRSWIGGGRHLFIGYAGAKGEGFDTFVRLRDALRTALGADACAAVVIAPPEAVSLDQERIPVLVDTAREFATAYGATPGAAWIVRPDGYLGWHSAAPDDEALRDYLAKVAAR